MTSCHYKQQVNCSGPELNEIPRVGIWSAVRVSFFQILMLKSYFVLLCTCSTSMYMLSPDQHVVVPVILIYSH